MLILGLIDIPVWLILVTVGIIAFLWNNTRDFNFFAKQGLKGPRPLPLVGTMRLWGEWLKKFPWTEVKLHNTYGDIVPVFFGSRAGLTVFDDSFLSQVLVKDFSNFTDRVNFTSGDELFEKMLSNARGESWKDLRTVMSPVFSTGKLKRMAVEINRCGAQMAENLAEQHGQELEMKKCASSFTLDVIAATAFGIRLDSLKDKESAFVKNGLRAFKISPLTFFVLFFPGLQKVLNLLGLKTFVPTDVRNFFIGVLEQTMKSRRQDSDQTRADFLQLMINAQKGEDIRDTGEDAEGDESEVSDLKDRPQKHGVSNEVVMANSVLFFLAGFDTTATALSLFLYNMALNPDCQEKLAREIDDTVGDKDVKYETVKGMQYLDQCVMESLRFYPPAFQGNREAARDVTINGIHLRKGMMVNIPIFGIHHDEKRWPEPEKFKPERFSAENKAQRSPFDWIPFGYGPRNCIAMRLALLEVKIAIIHILRKTRVSTCGKTEIPLTFNFAGLLQPMKGVWLKVENRNKDN